ncbi:MAG: hypothetical protein EAZ35_00170 [Sphingobacteriia bacterium]|nr:MAG: hypothetical protein EAZ35_00170 [Sphingobacteriia bacterium]
MQTVKKLLSLFLFALAFACNKEVSEDFISYSISNPLNDTTWAKNITVSAAIHTLADSTFPLYFSDSIDAETNTTISFPNNLELTFPPNIFTNNSQPSKLTGKLLVQVIRLEKESDFIFAGKATYNNIPLESDGALFIRVLKNGQELSLLPNTAYTIRFINKDNLADDNMKVYTGVESSPLISSGIDFNFSWNHNILVQSQVTIYNKQITGGGYVKGYQITAKQLRWIAVAKPMEPSFTKTKLSAYLPLNFTNKNTLVFAIFNDHKTVVQLKPDYISRTFSATDFPNQKKIKLISISVIGKNYYFSKLNINAVNNIPAFSLKPEKKSLLYIFTELTK